MHQQLILARYKIPFGRMGDIHGLFICTKEELQSLYGRVVHFGEILGKHSSISHTFIGENFHILDPEVDGKNALNVIETLLSFVGHKTISGINPLDYVNE